MTTDKTTESSPAKGTPDPTQADFSRDAGAHTAGEFIRDYISRVRGGEVGALPAVLGLVVLIIVFSQASDRFLTVFNLANLISQAGITVFIAMGLVFVLLLGEIDLAAGTASGVTAGLMAMALVSKGDLHKGLGTILFLSIAAFLLLAIGAAVLSRLWIAAVLVGIGLLMVLTNVGTSNAVGAIYIAVAGGIAIGLLNGFLVAWVGIPSFVVTLALFLGWQGILLQMAGDGGAISVRQFGLINGIANKNLNPVLGWVFFIVLIGIYTGYTVWRSVRRRAQGLSAEPMIIVLSRAGGLALIGAVGLYFLNLERSPNPQNTSIKGAPYVLPLIIVFMIGWTLVLSKTRFGRYVYAVGGNAEAARRAGVDLRRIRMAAFAIGSAMAALGGVVQASRLGGVPSDAGAGNTLLFAVAAAVIGGTSLFGGKGRARDAVIGGLVIAMIPNGLGLLPNLPSSTNFVITCVVLLVAASVDALSRKRASASGR
jgi:D-xylose transport system permease protein